MFKFQAHIAIVVRTGSLQKFLVLQLCISTSPFMVFLYLVRGNNQLFVTI